MATIQRNSPWHDKTEVKRGDYGEELVRKILEQHNFIVYQAITDGAHLIDFIIELNKNFIFAVDVKTKSMMKKYAETGIDYDSYQYYRDFSQKAHMPVLLVFVDPSKGKIYGNFLSVLDEPRIQYGIRYPKTMATKYDGRNKKIRYYPECAMLPLGEISPREVDFLNSCYTGNY